MRRAQPHSCKVSFNQTKLSLCKSIATRAQLLAVVHSSGRGVSRCRTSQVPQPTCSSKSGGDPVWCRTCKQLTAPDSTDSPGSPYTQVSNPRPINSGSKNLNSNSRPPSKPLNSNSRPSSRAQCDLAQCDM